MNGRVTPPANLPASNALGAGATVQAGTNISALSPWADIRHRNYGARCDGHTDDTPALNAALQAVFHNGGGTVYIPSTGHPCLIAGQIVIPQDSSDLGGNPIRITGALGTDGSGSVLDLTYAGPPAPGLGIPTASGTIYPKIVDLAHVRWEVDHLSLEDTADGTQPFIFAVGELHLHDTEIRGLASKVRLVTDAACSAGSNVLTSPSANFSSADVGVYAGVVGANAARRRNFTLATAIAAVISPSRARLAANCTRSVTGAQAAIGNYQDGVVLGSSAGRYQFVGYGVVIRDNSFVYYNAALRLGADADGIVVEGNHFNAGVGLAPIVINGQDAGDLDHGNKIVNNYIETSDDWNGDSPDTTPYCYQYAIQAQYAIENYFAGNDIYDMCGGVTTSYRFESTATGNVVYSGFQDQYDPFLSEGAPYTNAFFAVPNAYGQATQMPGAVLIPGGGYLRFLGASSAPASVAAGEIYYDTSLGALRVANGSAFQSLATSNSAGYPRVVASTAQTGLTGSIRFTPVFTPAGSAVYRACVQVIVTSTTATAGNISATLRYTTYGNATGHSLGSANASSAGGDIPPQPCHTFEADRGRPIQYGITYSASGGGATYNLRVTVEQLTAN